MTPMAPTRPNRQFRPASPVLSGSPYECRIRLAADLAAAAVARAEVGDAIHAWHVPVDEDVALLLTSELVTNAVMHGTATRETFVTLIIACGATGLRVDVHDGSGDLPVLEDVPAEAETGRGLLLVTSLSAEWGFYRTPAGKAVYFTLDFRSEGDQNVTAAPD
jgi:anti-sigma regulatory factor (Ser/Thr protein kinase)